jgi:hypothetical protein
MLRHLVILWQTWDKPWYGKTPSRVQNFATGPGNLELAERKFLPVPGAIVAEVHRVGPVGLFQEPQRPRGSHHEARRVGSDMRGTFRHWPWPSPANVLRSPMVISAAQTWGSAVNSVG